VLCDAVHSVCSPPRKPQGPLPSPRKHPDNEAQTSEKSRQRMRCRLKRLGGSVAASAVMCIETRPDRTRLDKTRPGQQTPSSAMEGCEVLRTYHNVCVGSIITMSRKFVSNISAKDAQWRASPSGQADFDLSSSSHTMLFP